MRTRQRARRRSGSLLEAYTARHAGAIAHQRSVVALRAARIEAELAYKARGTFLAHMNHELRTPLNAIMGFAGLLKEADAYGFAAEQRGEYLDHILESSELLLSHINTILEVADAESGGAKLDKRAFVPSDLIGEVAEEAEEELAARQVTIALDTQRELPLVLADPDRIATALRHLLRFAAHGVEAGARLTVSARVGASGETARWVYVAVAAPGDRRTEDEIGEALRVFDRVHAGLHRSVDLSLPIAKSFVELNGGRFNTKAQASGGRIFRFALPRAAEAAVPLDLATASAA